MWDNQDDARMRLHGSVLRYNRAPILVEKVEADLTIEILYLKSRNRKRVRLDDPELDLSPVPTGYVNTDKAAIFVERSPIRRWKKGLHPDNVKVIGARHIVGAKDIVLTRQFADTVYGHYPTYKDVLQKMSNPEVESVAFSRLYALSREQLGLLMLLRKGVKVGWIENGELKLGAGKEYLAEELKEAVEDEA